MNTTFYSTKVHRNVGIPNNKVCGYRVKNYATKKGWSSSVRAGRDNQYNQKFHRFSTDVEAECKNKCEGNRNWLNEDQRMEFMNTREGQPFEIRRPSFKAGISYTQDKEADSISGINQRRGMGNYEINRNNFKAPKIKPRQVVDFDKLQALNIEQAGQKVQFGESTIKALFEVAIPDKTDTKWLNEKARLTALYRAQGMTQEQIDRELEVNKPLGREQRKTKEKRNIAESGLSTGSKLDEIEQEIKEGRAENMVQQATLTGQISALLRNVDAVRKMSDGEFKKLTLMLSKLNVPKNYKALKLGMIIDEQTYKDNAGIINMFLLSNVPPNRSSNKPLLMFDESRNNRGWKPKGIEEIPASFVNGKLINLQNRTLVSPAYLQSQGIVPPYP